MGLETELLWIDLQPDYFVWNNGDELEAWVFRGGLGALVIRVWPTTTIEAGLDLRSSGSQSNMNKPGVWYRPGTETELGPMRSGLEP